MKILLDECVPVQVRRILPLHEVLTAQELGWCGVSNGELLHAAQQGGFDLFILADKNLRYQQNLSLRKIAILEHWTNHRPTLQKHFALISNAVDLICPGEYKQLLSIE